MTDQRSEEPEERRRATDGPVGTMLGTTVGPFGFALGSVIDRNRAAFAFAFGTGASRRRGDGLDDAATVEVTAPSEDGAGASDGTEAAEGQ